MSGELAPPRGPRAPHPLLRGLVADYQGYHHSGLAPGVHHGLPALGLTLIVAFDEPIDVGWRSDPASRGKHWAMVSGLHVDPALIHHTGFQHGVQLDLTPLGARVLLGVPAGALAGALTPLRMDPAYDAMAAAASWDDRFAALDAELLRRAEAARTTTIRGELREAWRRIRRSGGDIRVGDLATEVGCPDGT